MKAKKIISLFLALMICLSLVSPAFAVSTTDGFRYDIIDNSYVKITDYTGSATKLVIPSKINGYPVKKIDNWAFEYSTFLTSVTIPDSVASIGDCAFYECYDLKSVTLGNSVTSIGDSAFYLCIRLTSITIPDSVTSIGKYVFHYCDRLTIYGVKGSYAETYAKENKIPFVACELPTVSTLIPNEESEYTIDTEKGILNGVEEKTTLETLISNLENSESIVVTKPTGEEVTDININIGTGWVINLVDESGETVDSVTVVVKGDITGDGIVNSRDIAALQRQVLALETLEGVYLLTADMNMDGEVNSRDIARVQKMVLE